MQSDSVNGWYSDETATLGDRLAAAREKQGFDQAGLARKLGVRDTTVAQWEADASEPRSNRVQMLAGLLGVSLRWLLTGEGDGVEDPDNTSRPDPHIAAILSELRDAQGQMVALARRFATLERRLRTAQVTRECA
jgi:transcriptional regulator with XRE-family HTH domain